MTAPAPLDPVVIDGVAAIVREAADLILAAARRGPQTRVKADASPVTDADEAANRLIVTRLSALSPGVPIVAEESIDDRTRPTPRFWLVDPLDGTREFIDGRDEYTVNIALIASGRPVLGVVGAPARGVCFGGIAGRGAWREDDTGGRRPIAVRASPAAGPTAVASRSHRDRRTDAWLARAGVVDIVRAGSSLKFCAIAGGGADLYPRFGRTMEWDTAAGHAVLVAAGGQVHTVDGEPLAYGKPGFENPPFIARGSR